MDGNEHPDEYCTNQKPVCNISLNGFSTVDCKTTWKGKYYKCSFRQGKSRKSALGDECFGCTLLGILPENTQGLSNCIFEKSPTESSMKQCIRD